MTLRLIALGLAAVAAFASKGPCDIYDAAGTPCVAAHSMVRALYSAYEGPLYSLRRESDNKTLVINVKPGTGFADSEKQVRFCFYQQVCRVERIYDQSPRGNHLIGVVVPSPNNHSWPVTFPNAMREQIFVGGHRVYSAYFEGGQTGKVGTGKGTMGFRSNSKNGTATGDQPESMYMVASGTHWNDRCCFDYGNSEISNQYPTPPPPDASRRLSPGQMEALYFGANKGWGYGKGPGPWVQADLENGIWSGDKQGENPTNIGINATFLTAMLKGKPGGWSLKGGNARSGPLTTFYSGKRPSGYNPMKKQGAIVLGIGGDNSDLGEGTFYEGAVIAGYTSEETDNAVQANIVAAGYGQDPQPLSEVHV